MVSLLGVDRLPGSSAPGGVGGVAVTVCRGSDCSDVRLSVRRGRGVSVTRKRNGPCSRGLPCFYPCSQNKLSLSYRFLLFYGWERSRKNIKTQKLISCNSVPEDSRTCLTDDPKVLRLLYKSFRRGGKVTYYIQTSTCPLPWFDLR